MNAQIIWENLKNDNFNHQVNLRPQVLRYNTIETLIANLADITIINGSIQSLNSYAEDKYSVKNINMHKLCENHQNWEKNSVKTISMDRLCEKHQ